jgi:hypothetical protein
VVALLPAQDPNISAGGRGRIDNRQFLDRLITHGQFCGTWSRVRHVADAVVNGTAVSMGAELLGCGKEQVSVRFGLFDLIAGHDWRLSGIGADRR